MASKNLGEISKELYDLLLELEPDDRRKVVSSAMALFGEIKNETFKYQKNNQMDQKFEGNETAKNYFAEKNPENRGESLAVAARYIELKDEKDILKKEDIAKIFKDARRNFDSKNFSRDISNAVNNAKFFLSGDEKESYKLSFYGQEYVDALPNKDLAKKIKKPGKSKKKQAKKSEE